MKESITKYKAKMIVSRADMERSLFPSLGLVNFWVRGQSASLPSQNFAPANQIRSLKEGLPVAELEDLRSQLDLSMEKLVALLGISKATWHRRKISGKLDPTESDRVVRFARLLGRAKEVMETLENGRHWLMAAQVGLGGAVPLDYAETEIGAREVEELLGRIEYGVYS